MVDAVVIVRKIHAGLLHRGQRPERGGVGPRVSARAKPALDSQQQQRKIDRWMDNNCRNRRKKRRENSERVAG